MVISSSCASYSSMYQLIEALASTTYTTAKIQEETSVSKEFENYTVYNSYFMFLIQCECDFCDGCRWI